MADVPLGMFLSGGIDSARDRRDDGRSSTTDQDLLGRVRRARGERARITRGWSRSAFAPTHHEIVVTPSDFFDALPRLVWHEDEPIAHPSSVALYFVSRARARAREGRAHGRGQRRAARRLRPLPRDALSTGALGRPTSGWCPRSLRGAVRDARRADACRARCGRTRARTFLRDAARRPTRCSSTTSRSFRAPSSARCSRATRARAATAPIRTRRRTRASTRADGAHACSTGCSTPTSRPICIELLMKQDQMSMAASIESRVPFLDHKLVEFAAGAAATHEAARLHDEVVLREAMRGILPPEILDAARRWASRCRSAAGSAAAVNGVVDEYVLGDARARQRGCSSRRAAIGCRAHAPGGREQRRAALGADQPRDLAAHLLRRRGPADAAGDELTGARARRGGRSLTRRRRTSHRVHILWLKTDLLHPLDKGGSSAPTP